MIASDRFVSLEEVGDSLCQVVNHIVDKRTGRCWFFYPPVGQAEDAATMIALMTVLLTERTVPVSLTTQSLSSVC